MRQKKGQVTIFIIIAVIIVAGIALMYKFMPEIKSNLGFSDQDPSQFIQTCLEDTLIGNIEVLSKQGGVMEPEFFYMYDDSKLDYLCYTSENFESCTVQKPLLKASVEKELLTSIENAQKKCFDSLVNNYKEAGKEIMFKEGEMNLEIVPERVIVKFNHTLILKGETSEKYENFVVILNNNLYELVNTATEIISYETTYGDSETTYFMDKYHNIKVEKQKRTDGTTVYILTQRDSGQKFQFASRSFVFPSGFGKIKIE